MREKRCDMPTLLRRIYNSYGATRALKLVSHLVTLLSVAAFFVLVFFFWRISFFSLARYLLILGVPFLCVTLVRRWINAPRPFELYDFYILPPRKECGRSFPSRHAYSAFAIGAALSYVSLPLGIALLILGALMCCARVLLGLHFVRDVACGAAVGVISVLLGFLIISPL